MQDDVFILDQFKQVNKKVMLLGIIFGVCAYSLNKKIRKQEAEIKKLSEELENQKGD